MKFITVIDNDKIDEIMDTGFLRFNCAFELEDSCREILVSSLKELNVDSESIVNGYCIDERYGDLSNNWLKYLNNLPIKTGDIIVQFGVEVDECIFCDFNEFMQYNYCNEYERISDIITYRFDDSKIAFIQELDLAQFEKAFIVSEEWSHSDLVDSFTDNKVITNIRELSHISDSSIWRAWCVIT